MTRFIAWFRSIRDAHTQPRPKTNDQAGSNTPTVAPFVRRFRFDEVEFRFRIQRTPKGIVAPCAVFAKKSSVEDTRKIRACVPRRVSRLAEHSVGH